MSYDVYLEDRSADPCCDYGGTQPAGCPVPCYPAVDVDRHREGGTYVLGGTTEACLNITYNYSSFYYRNIDAKRGLSWLDGKRASECIARLEEAVKDLGTDRSQNYWEATPGNAGLALEILLNWARQHPDAVFRVSS